MQIKQLYDQASVLQWRKRNVIGISQKVDEGGREGEDVQSQIEKL